MSLLVSLSGLFARGEDCRPCDHFCTDPRRIEAELPGLSALSSAHGSVRARDGLCVWHQRIINGRRRCAQFCQRGQVPSC